MRKKLGCYSSVYGNKNNQKYKLKVPLTLELWTTLFTCMNSYLGMNYMHEKRVVDYSNVYGKRHKQKI